MAIDRNGDPIYASAASMPVYHGYEDEYSQTRTSRIKRLLFPEFEADDVHKFQAELRSSVVYQLSEKSISLRNAVVDLIKYRDEVDSSLQSIPTLIEMLASSDERMFSQAINDVYLLSKKDKKILSNLTGNERLIGSLVSAASRSSDEDVQRKAAAALRNFSEEATGRMLLFRTGGIPQLVAMLSSHIPNIVIHATKTLYNLLLYIEAAKEETTRCGGLQAFTRLLYDPNRKLQAMVAECVHFLMKNCPENKLQFLALQGPTVLIKILYDPLHDYPKLVSAVIRCIRTISTCNRNKASLIQIGAMEALRIHLETSDENGKKAILQSIRNLSDAATNVDSLDRLVVDLIILIERHHHEEVISCACGILSNLTCNNVRNKQTICSNSGVTVLCDALQRFAHVEDVTEPALCTLRHCTARHSLAQQAQNDIRQCQFAYGVMLELLATRRLPIVKAALGLVRNCALSRTNLEGIVSVATIDGTTVVGVALEVLVSSGRILLENFDAEDEGFKHLDMVESAVSALHQLATDHGVADFIAKENVPMTVLISLLSLDEVNNSEDELLMREIMGLIYQLTKNPENAKIVEGYGPTEYIAGALRSHHKSIATYASGILKNLEREKPLEYQRQLDTEIHSALGNDGYDGMEPELFSEMYGNYGNLDIGADNQAWYDTDL